jgi:hypothetical protein
MEIMPIQYQSVNNLSDIINKLIMIENDLEYLSYNSHNSVENSTLNKSKVLLDIVVNFIREINTDNKELISNKNIVNSLICQPFSLWSSPIIINNKEISTISCNSSISYESDSFKDENKTFASVLKSNNQIDKSDNFKQLSDSLELSSDSEDNIYHSRYNYKFDDDSQEMQNIYKKYHNNTDELKIKLTELAEKRKNLPWHCWYNLTERHCEKEHECMAEYHYNNLSKDELTKIRSSVCCPLYIYGMCKKGCPEFKLLHVPSNLKVIGRKKCVYHEKQICSKGKYCFNYHPNK